jgi:hypothetical protein
MLKGRQRRDWFWLLPLLLAVAACGPGVGGTGTGEGFALEFFGAKRASVCSSSFAGTLKCPSTIVIGPTPIDESAGSEPVLWVDDPGAAQIIVRINASEAELNAQCGGYRFAGTWGETEDGTRRFFGHYSAPGADVAMPGKLLVESEGERVLSYTLTDAKGGTLFGPVSLLRTEAEPTLSSCSTVSPSPLGGATFR